MKLVKLEGTRISTVADYIEGSEVPDGSIAIPDDQYLEMAMTQCRFDRARRYEAEASVYDLADAETKLASPDATLQAEGAAQKAAVLAKRLQIKSEIPLPL